MNEIFDKIFIINLNSRTDRWNDIKNEMKSLNITNYERFSAIKPNFNFIPIEWYNKFKSPHRNLEKYIISAIGCKKSHYDIIKLSKNRAYKRILILEDDCQFIGNINILINNIDKLKNWDMLYLSGNHRLPLINYDENIKKVSCTLTTHSYALHEKAFDSILNNMLESGLEIDNYYITFIQSQHNSFCLSPGITTQRESYSDVLNRNTNYQNVIY